MFYNIIDALSFSFLFPLKLVLLNVGEEAGRKEFSYTAGGNVS
jgi:hypothetical protein